MNGPALPLRFRVCLHQATVGGGHLHTFHGLCCDHPAPRLPSALLFCLLPPDRSPCRRLSPFCGADVRCHAPVPSFASAASTVQTPPGCTSFMCPREAQCSYTSAQSPGGRGTAGHAQVHVRGPDRVWVGCSLQAGASQPAESSQRRKDEVTGRGGPSVLFRSSQKFFKTLLNCYSS